MQAHGCHLSFNSVQTYMHKFPTSWSLAKNTVRIGFERQSPDLRSGLTRPQIPYNDDAMPLGFFVALFVRIRPPRLRGEIESSPTVAPCSAQYWSHYMRFWLRSSGASWLFCPIFASA